jgi:eukaryotic-like serine/threonine-protein kinase
MSMPIDKFEERFAGYSLLNRIGAGGYGEVWKAEAPGGLAKAVKFVYGVLAEERASRELKALQRIKEVRHPFLLSLERIEIIDGRLVIITELADTSLKERCQQCCKSGLPGIPRGELLRYLRDTAEALDYMSSQFSLQHLDIKP